MYEGARWRRGREEEEVVATRCHLPPLSFAPSRKTAGREEVSCQEMEQEERERGERKKAGWGG